MLSVFILFFTLYIFAKKTGNETVCDRYMTIFSQPVD